MLSLFTVLAVLLCTVSKEIASNEGSFGIQFENVMEWDPDFVIRIKFEIVDAKSGGVALKVQLRVV